MQNHPRHTVRDPPLRQAANEPDLKIGPKSYRLQFTISRAGCPRRRLHHFQQNRTRKFEFRVIQEFQIRQRTVPLDGEPETHLPFVTGPVTVGRKAKFPDHPTLEGFHIPTHKGGRHFPARGFVSGRLPSSSPGRKQDQQRACQQDKVFHRSRFRRIRFLKIVKKTFTATLLPKKAMKTGKVRRAEVRQ